MTGSLPLVLPLTAPLVIRSGNPAGSSSGGTYFRVSPASPIVHEIASADHAVAVLSARFRAVPPSVSVAETAAADHIIINLGG